MCGIVAVATRRSSRIAPDVQQINAEIKAAIAITGVITATGTVAADVLRLADLLVGIDRGLQGVPGVRSVLADPAGALQCRVLCEELTAAVAECESRLDAGLETGAVTDSVEDLNSALVRVKDAVWALGHDRLQGAASIAELAGSDRGVATLEAYYAIQVTFAALDRLEVRGRDSSGLHVLVQHHGLDLASPEVATRLKLRQLDPLFGARSVRVVGDCLSFVYKTAAEIGELGDNTAALRAQILSDDLLRLAVANEDAKATVVAHTRWASVGIISEANAHPLNSEEIDGDGQAPYVVASLNGDVDNYIELTNHESLRIPLEITTDAKVIPVLVSRRVAAGAELVSAFRSTVSEFEGSVAICAASASAPGVLLLGQRGSGQALYVGLGEDTFIVASEPYGLVEVAPKYFRLDGETMRNPGDPTTQGQIVVLDANFAGTLEGVHRIGYEGVDLAVSESDLLLPEMTTRDVDRGNASHYFLKELTESPESLRKTLRGKVVANSSGQLSVQLDESMLPKSIREKLREGVFRNVFVIGQGTAAIAGQSLAHALARTARGAVNVDAIAATELSGFGLLEDMHHCLVIAISQSGTTTDTNRTVDLCRARGASILAIVNRRQSDLVDKSDGVLFTSDGRDVEMAVASTKAFYAQIAAGVLLAYAIGIELGTVDAHECHTTMQALRELPAAMHQVVAQRSNIAAMALRHAPYRRSWTVVGNGVNRVAAQEARIKLSELCYKSIGCDTTEDKKHIDLSAEPLILVCAAGLTGSNADDVAKEVAIFRAHKAAPVVIATLGEDRFSSALDTIFVPAVHPNLDFVLSAMAGHLFGYEAALCIDASARPMREARGIIEAIVLAHIDDDERLDALRNQLGPSAAQCFALVRSGSLNGALEASTGVRLIGLLRYAVGLAALDGYELEFGKVATPSTLIEDLADALTTTIDELTRPVDAIKHQAKTVTVGISRSDETLLRVGVVREVLSAGSPRDSLSYRSLRTLVELDAAVASVVGFTRYRIEGDIEDGATIHVVDRGGIAATMTSRTQNDPRLRGSKHRAAFEREVTVVRGRADGRTMIFVPEVKGAVSVGLNLLHVQFHGHLDAETARRVLQGYRGRYAAIQDQVTETEPSFDDAVLSSLDMVALLTEPVAQLAEHWRR